MIKRNSLGANISTIPANNIITRNTSIRSAIFTRSTDIEQRNVLDAMNRNSKTSSFQKRRIGFGLKINRRRNNILRW
jgi:hypothetical protein